jgi:hypothetical protein
MSPGYSQMVTSALEEINRLDHSFPVYPGSPLSIYIPQAGFLWSDDKYWNEDAGVFEQIAENEFDDTDWQLEGDEENNRTEPQRPRVYFSDSVGRTSEYLH